MQMQPQTRALILQRLKQICILKRYFRVRKKRDRKPVRLCRFKIKVD